MKKHVPLLHFGMGIMIHQLFVVIILKVLEKTDLLNSSCLLDFAYVLAVVVLLFIIIYTTIKRKRAGEPENDELSLKIRNRAYALAGGLNLFIWIELDRFGSKIESIESLMGIGFFLSVLTFIISYIIIRFTYNENKD